MLYKPNWNLDIKIFCDLFQEVPFFKVQSRFTTGYAQLCNWVLSRLWNQQVSANHEEKAENGETRRRLFIRQYRLPKGVEVDQLKPSLSQDGVLTIEAPAPSLQPTERLIPIEYTKTAAQVGGGDEKK